MSDFDSLDFPCLPGMGCPCREAERAAIVAWLRAEHTRLEALANKQSGYMRDDWTDGGANFVDFAADAIEDCAYMRGDDE